MRFSPRPIFFQGLSCQKHEVVMLLVRQVRYFPKATNSTATCVGSSDSRRAIQALRFVQCRRFALYKSHFVRNFGDDSRELKFNALGTNA